MKKPHLFILALIAIPFSAIADDRGLVYVAGGASKYGANFSIGAGTQVDALELSSINLGTVGGNASARFIGLSLVQNAVPIGNFNLLFRLGVGKTTTTFTSGAQATRIGFGNGIILGVGAQYQLNSHLAFRGELDHIPYAVSPDGFASGVRYPATISAVFFF